MYKQRILIVHNYYQIPGGEDTVVANERKMLEDNGHKVFMYTRHNDEIKERNIFGKIKLPFETIYSLKTKKEVIKIIKENRIDIVHVHNTLPLISPSVYWAGKECGIKVVQTVHNFRLLCPAATFVCADSICEDCVTNGLKCSIRRKCYRNSKIQTLIVASMLKINRIIGSYKKVDAYIALTKFNKEKLSSLIVKEKIYIKPNFCNKPEYQVIPANNREYFMFLGRIDKLKGIYKLVEAWKNIKNDKLIIAGSGPYDMIIQNYIKDNNMNNVMFLGRKSNEESKKILSKAKALIVPSQWYEGLPMTIIEALSLGVPVIGSDIGNIYSVLKEGEIGYIWDGKKNTLEYIVNKFHENRNLDLYVENSLREYITKYTVDKNYSILQELYNNIGGQR